MGKYVKEHKRELILVCVLLLQLIAIMVYNLTKLRYQSDFDSSSGALQAVEIWRQKTLLIHDWVYQTTVGWDNPLLFAVLFYGLTKSIFLSMGIANNLFVLAFVYVIYDILRKSGIRTSGIMMSLIIFFTPYTLGQLGWVSMLFTGTASYSMKVLITLLLLDILVRMENGISLKRNLCHIFVLLAISILSGLSSGIYMLICGVVPVVFYLVLRMLVCNDPKLIRSRYAVITMLGVVSFLVGGVLARGMGLTNNSSSMRLLSVEKLSDNALNCFAGIWELLGAAKPEQSPMVISKEGILCLLCAAITAFILFVIVYYAVQIIRKKEKRMLVGIVLSIVFVNFCVLLLADTTYSSSTFESRYHIVAMVPAMLLTGVFFHDICDKWNVLCKNTFFLGVTVAVLVASIGNFTFYFKQAQTARINELSKITDLAKEQDIDLIYFISTDDDSLKDGRILRVSDMDINVSTLTTYDVGIAWGGSSRYFENGTHDGKIMVVVNRKNLKKMPDYITSRMDQVDRIAGYRIYTAEENVFDCATGLPEQKGEKTVDFPYSPWYQISGTIQDTGELTADAVGGIVMYGMQVKPEDGVFDIRLNFRCDEEKKKSGEKAGTFGIYTEAGEAKGSVDIIAGQECIMKGVTLQEALGMLHYSVEAVPDSGMHIESIVAEKME